MTMTVAPDAMWLTSKLPPLLRVMTVSEFFVTSITHA